MAEVRYDDAGNPYELVPGSRDRWRPIAPGRAAAVEEVGEQGFARQLGGAVASAGQSLALGARSLGQGAQRALGYDVAPEDAAALAAERARNEQYRQALGEESGLAGGVGMAAEFAPDVALMLGTGGGSIPASLARRGLMVAGEAALGGVHSPDAPLTGMALGAAGGALAGPAGRMASVGARRGVALAETAMTTVRNATIRREGVEAVLGAGRFAEAAEPFVRGVANLGRRTGLQDVNAIRAGMPVDEALMARIRQDAGRASGSINAAQVAKGDVPYEDQLTGLQERVLDLGDRGVPISEGDLRWATAQGDEALTAAETMRFDEDIATSNPMDARGATVKQVRDQQEEWLTKEIGSRLGDPNVRMLDDATLAPLRQSVGDEFDRLLARGDDQADLQVTLTPDDGARIRDAFDDVPDTAQSASFRALRDEVARIVDAGKPLDAKKFASVRNKLNEVRKRLLDKGSTYDAGTALSEAEDVITNRYKAGLSKDDQAAFGEAQHKWKIIKALEANLRSTDAGGKVNTATFANAYLGKKPNIRGDEFGKDLEAMRFLTQRLTPTSGTSERLQGGLLKGLGAVGAGGGLLSLFGG